MQGNFTSYLQVKVRQSVFSGANDVFTGGRRSFSGAIAGFSGGRRSFTGEIDGSTGGVKQKSTNGEHVPNSEKRGGV